MTGIGAVTPLGTGVKRFHEQWTAGVCGITEGVGRCDDFDPGGLLTRREIRRLDRFAQLALCAAHEAVSQAGWLHDLPADPHRIGCVIGTGAGTTMTLERLYELHRAPDGAPLPPLGATMAMANAASAAITLAFGLHGESFAVAAACAAGSQAIGIGKRMLESGHLDAVVVGGADASATEWSYRSFSVMGALSPTGVVRPFDRRRDGMVLGEGGGVLVLERREIATQRDAEILAEVLGYGASSDAFHITRPDPTGEGPARAITNALVDAGLGPEDIDYVNAHGTGTRLNDPSETLALKSALGAHAYDIPVSAPKSAIGHLFGGAGAVEAIGTITALRARTAPPTLNLEHPDDGLDLDYVPQQAKPLRPRRAPSRLIGLKNSFAFGGHNAALIIACEHGGPASG